MLEKMLFEDPNLKHSVAPDSVQSPDHAFTCIKNLPFLDTIIFDSNPYVIYKGGAQLQRGDGGAEGLALSRCGLYRQEQGATQQFPSLARSEQT